VENNPNGVHEESGQSHVHMHVRNPGSSTCHHCLLAFPTGAMHVALVPDSSFVHAEDPSLDGCRLVRACGTEHLSRLIEYARANWVVEQLWLGRLARSSTLSQTRGTSVRQVARLAGLSPERLRQALAWNAGRADPLRELPGGQRLPTRDAEPTAEPTAGPLTAAREEPPAPRQGHDLADMAGISPPHHME
jgi:hypothetical protein